MKNTLFEAILNSGESLNIKSFKIMEEVDKPEEDEKDEKETPASKDKPAEKEEAPKKKDADLPDPDADTDNKEFLGSREGVYYYMVTKEDEAEKDVIVQDQEETQVFSAKENDLDVEDVLGVVIAAAQDLGLEYLTFSVFQKYALPVIQNEEDEEEVDTDALLGEEDAEGGEEAEEPAAAPDFEAELKAKKDDEDEEDDEDEWKIKDSISIKLSGKSYLLERRANKTGERYYLNSKHLKLSEAQMTSLFGEIEGEKLRSLAAGIKATHEGIVPDNKDKEEAKIKKLTEEASSVDYRGYTIDVDQNKLTITLKKGNKKAPVDTKAKDYEPTLAYAKKWIDQDVAERKRSGADIDEGIVPDNKDKEEAKIKKLTEEADEVEEPVDEEAEDAAAVDESIAVGKTYIFTAFVPTIGLTESVVKSKLGDDGFKQYQSYNGQPVKVIALGEGRCDIKFLKTRQVVPSINIRHLASA